MIELTPTPEQIIYAANMIREFDIINGETKTTTYSDDERLNGLIAEIMIQDILGLPRATKGFDNGHDIIVNGLRFDIKCNTNRVLPSRVCSFDVRSTTLFNHADGFIFVHYCQRNNVYYVTGWLSKFDFLKYADFCAKGSVKPRSNITYWYDAYTVCYSHILPVQSLDRIGGGFEL